MATKISKLSLELTANTTGLTKGFQRARQQTNRFTSRVNRLQPRLSGIGGAMGGVTTKLAGMAAAFVSVSVAIGQVTQSMDRLGGLGEASERLGIDPAALKTLQDTAEIISRMDATQTTQGFQRFARRLAEAAAGSGELLPALQELNLDAGELAEMPLDQAILRFGRALRDIESPQERLRLAFKAFDSEGAKLVTTLTHLADNQQEYNQSVADNKAAGVTKESLEQTRRLEQQIALVNQQWTTMVDKLTMAIAPALADLLASLNSHKGIWEAIQVAVDGVAGAINGVAGLMDTINAKAGSNTPLGFMIENVRRGGQALGALGQGDVRGFLDNSLRLNPVAMAGRAAFASTGGQQSRSPGQIGGQATGRSFENWLRENRTRETQNLASTKQIEMNTKKQADATESLAEMLQRFNQSQQPQTIIAIPR